MASGHSSQLDLSSGVIRGSLRPPTLFLRGTPVRSSQEKLLASNRSVRSVLGALEILPFETPAEIIYGDLRAQLEAAGKLIGGNDILIAAHAISLGHTIVTDNEREFSRVDGLHFENWLRF
jgi:tRNA(fMet)-specific endonuclease VapC